jgi:acyl carrier protein
MPSFSVIAGMLAEELERDASEIRPDTPLADLGVDSLAQVELMFDLEEKFDIRFGDDRPPLNVVQDIADIVDGLVALKGA